LAFQEVPVILPGKTAKSIAKISPIVRHTVFRTLKPEHNIISVVVFFQKIKTSAITKNTTGI
jgi:hypothetical protein